MRRVTEKWRPPVGLVVSAILLTVLSLPLASLFLFRFYENQLVRQTEAELIAQGAALAAVYARDLSGLAQRPPLGPVIRQEDADPRFGRYRPIEPTLDLAVDPILPPRPDAQPTNAPSPFAAAGAGMAGILAETQKATLTGFRLLDPAGIVIAGGSEVGASLAAVEEVQSALSGRYRSILRRRISDEPDPPLYSISRGTGIRVFVAMPIIVEGRIAGALYLSRTPNNILKHLYGERGKMALAMLSIVGATLLIAFVFIRTITGPMHELRRRTARIAAGDAGALQPLARNGTREMAQLSQAFLDMAEELARRSDAIRVFATHLSHELKSPLTAIQGAAELLRDEGDGMDAGTRQRFLANIVADAQRLGRLLQRLMELTRAENANRTNETTSLSQVLASLTFDDGLRMILAEGGDIALPMSGEALSIVLANLIDNAAKHGARHVAMAARRGEDRLSVEIRDDGPGISEANRDRIFEPFFTTRRETGGTGLGLGIVAALLKAHGGTIRLDRTTSGAGFTVELPPAPPAETGAAGVT
ncbi:sensor histidine kinase [Mangrovicella endophytica]|uniref:sensor histidine kinase n=1 Tax=Mangrovicella endophytica TaxID=2066697 RepID=UPI000C9E04D9|nr:ATP-binding protein [Mangrovicella endophytica]